MVVSHLGNLGNLGRPELVAFLEVCKRCRIVLGFEGAQAPETPRGAQLRIQFNHFFEGRLGFSKVIRVVQQRTDIPPAFLPLRVALQGLPVVPNRVVGLALFAGGGGLAGETFEVREAVTRRIRLTQKVWRREDQQDDDDRDKSKTWSAEWPLRRDRVTCAEHSLSMLACAFSPATDRDWFD